MGNSTLEPEDSLAEATIFPRAPTDSVSMHAFQFARACTYHNFTILQTTNASINLVGGNVDAPQCHSLSTREGVHSLQRQVEPIPCLITDINGGNNFGNGPRRGGVVIIQHVPQYAEFQPVIWGAPPM